MSIYERFIQAEKDAVGEPSPVENDAGVFVPTGPRQPLPGILWPVEEWISFGADAWDLDRRCVVCGGDLTTFDHARCWPSMDAVSPSEALSLDAHGRQIKSVTVVVPRNSTDSTDSTENDRKDWETRYLDRKIRDLEAQLAVAAADSALIDAIAEAGIVIRPLVNFRQMFGADGDRQSFPTWRAAALAALARFDAGVPLESKQ